MGGGGEHFRHPKIWSQSGGFYRGNPPNWKRNTLICTGILGLVMYGVSSYSRKIENWYRVGAFSQPVPSFLWNNNPNSAHRSFQEVKKAEH